MMQVAGNCLVCSNRFALDFDRSKRCPSCSQELFPHALGVTLDQCPVCGSAHVYRQKDFNRKIGVALIVAGAVGAYWTYGLSLIAVAVSDYLISRAVKEVGICYLCQSQFRGEAVARLPAFDLVLHDHYRAKRAKSWDKPKNST